MGNYSRNTFDIVKHYVSVRLQQGVPLVDADWNEMEDIRRFELQAFLKWFVGDGVPYGNDGFNIISIAFPAFGDITANVGDFVIQGGNGKGAGYCLVDGMEALIEENTTYINQELYNNPVRATAWKVDNLPPLAVSTNRTDLVFLDVWEREVGALEDKELINDDIGIETAVRLKREWVVRVLENCIETEVPAKWTVADQTQRVKQPRHAYYPLAQLHWKVLEDAPLILPTSVDLRKVGLRMPTDHEISQLNLNIEQLKNEIVQLNKKIDDLYKKVNNLAPKP
jgi:hypothetical protein